MFIFYSRCIVWSFLLRKPTEEHCNEITRIFRRRKNKKTQLQKQHKPYWSLSHEPTSTWFSLSKICFRIVQEAKPGYYYSHQASVIFHGLVNILDHLICSNMGASVYTPWQTEDLCLDIAYTLSIGFTKQINRHRCLIQFLRFSLSRTPKLCHWYNGKKKI